MKHLDLTLVSLQGSLADWNQLDEGSGCCPSLVQTGMSSQQITKPFDFRALRSRSNSIQLLIAGIRLAFVVEGNEVEELGYALIHGRLSTPGTFTPGCSLLSSRRSLLFALTSIYNSPC
jgi:hypothetical protein